MTAVAITREAKQFTGEIVKGLKDIGISLFSSSGRVLRGPKPKPNKQTGLSPDALFLPRTSRLSSTYEPAFVFCCRPARQLTTDRPGMQSSPRFFHCGTAIPVHPELRRGCPPFRPIHCRGTIHRALSVAASLQGAILLVARLPGPPSPPLLSSRSGVPLGRHLRPRPRAPLPHSSFRTKQADFFFRIRSRECVGLRREKSLLAFPISSFKF